MSFSYDVKLEITKNISKNICCQENELIGYILTNGNIINNLNNQHIRLITENGSSARRIYSYLKKICNISPQVSIKQNKKLRENNSYQLQIPVDNNFIENNILIEDNQLLINSKLKIQINKRNCCKKAFIKGVFLGNGSITNPESFYHVEIISSNIQTANFISEVINSFNLNSRVTRKKNNYVVYIKEAEQIALFLNIIGAHNELLRYENIRVLRDMRNNVNRIVNCETANLTKTVDAAVRQVDDINYINHNIGLQKLPKNLFEVAVLRLENTDATIKELGEMLDPPIGKSGINHRLKKISEIANEIRVKKGETT